MGRSKKQDLSVAWNDYNVLLTAEHWPAIHDAIGDLWECCNDAYIHGLSHIRHDAEDAMAKLAPFHVDIFRANDIKSVAQMRRMKTDDLDTIRDALVQLVIGANRLLESMRSGPEMDRLADRMSRLKPIVGRGHAEIGYIHDVRVFGTYDIYPTEPRRSGLKRDLRSFAWAKTDGICWYCGKRLNPFSDFHVDHVIPVAMGGGDDPENLVPSCTDCNVRKHTFSVDEFRSRQGVDTFWFEQRSDRHA